MRLGGEPFHRLPYAGANHQYLVQLRAEILPFPYICRNCGATLTDIKPYKFRDQRYLCDACHQKLNHASYLRYRPKTLARDKERYYGAKEGSPVAPSALIRKLKVLRAIVAGGLSDVTGREIVRCDNCGCDDIFFLEINHRNGGGTDERRTLGRNITLCQAVLKGRQVQDLNILCGPCNRLEYLKRRYPARHYPEVVWKPQV